jgi:hypothetical protein
MNSVSLEPRLCYGVGVISLHYTAGSSLLMHHLFMFTCSSAPIPGQYRSSLMAR